ncbi:DUF7504 family protein [Halovivax cerinus]|uniref:RecA-superfamily ATPase possibly involved in signal transduction n=1 Tax=Halovivax cerinus TaxID=1487865 RepID=A0ABD5NMQ7_9EURY|nr:hypothetical protein [Halovivax cerinus]
MGSELGVGVPESTSFAQALGTLKRNGSNVLLVGEPVATTHEHVCDTFLGSNDSAQRRIVVSTDRTRIPRDGSTDTDYLVLDPESSASALDLSPSESITELSVLGMVGREFVNRVDELDRLDDLDPATLRVCVNAVDELLERHDSEVVFRLLHVITTRTRRSRGMGHYHLPIDRESEAVRLFEPLFDAVVCLRTIGGELEHRWHLRDGETSTDWIPL